jgi:hypothetical protein
MLSHTGTFNIQSHKLNLYRGFSKYWTKNKIVQEIWNQVGAIAD